MESHERVLRGCSKGFCLTKDPSVTPKSAADNDAYAIGIRASNSGTTPTKHLSIYSNWCFRPNDLSADFKFPDMGDGIRSHNALGPRDEITTGPYVFSVDDLKAVQNGKTKLFFWGAVQYNDVFPDTGMHDTRFWTRLSGVQGNLSDPSKGVAFTFTTCNRYNCLDDECEEAGYSKSPPKATPDEIGCMKPPHDTSSP